MRVLGESVQEDHGLTGSPGSRREPIVAGRPDRRPLVPGPWPGLSVTGDERTHGPSQPDVQATFCATLVDEWARAGVTDAVRLSRVAFDPARSCACIRVAR